MGSSRIARLASQTILILGLCVLPSYAADMPIAISKALDAARNDCANFENGALDIPADAVERIDLTGNGLPIGF